MIGRQAADRAGVALRDPAIHDGCLNLVIELEQSQRIRDGRASAADPLRQGLLGEPEVRDELPERECDLDRVEVVALEVLDKGKLELLRIGQLANDCRDPLEPSRTRSPDSSLTGYELVSVEDLGHEDRLDHAVFGDARHERAEFRLVERSARLERVGADPI
jgi:hypothetical protein